MHKFTPHWQTQMFFSAAKQTFTIQVHNFSINQTFSESSVCALVERERERHCCVGLVLNLKNWYVLVEVRLGAAVTCSQGRSHHCSTHLGSVCASINHTPPLTSHHFKDHLPQAIRNQPIFLYRLPSRLASPLYISLYLALSLSMQLVNVTDLFVNFPLWIALILMSNSH